MSRVTSLHIYQTPFTNDSRIVKETRSLIEAGVVDECVVLAMSGDGLLPEESFGSGRTVRRLAPATRRLRPSRRARAVQVIEWLGHVLAASGRERPTVVHAHSITTLPVGVWMKRRYGCRLVYDAHELETESASATGLKKPVSKLVERILIREADAVLVVSESIRRWYERSYGLRNVHLVRNVPEVRHGVHGGAQRREWRRSLGVPDDALLFLYQGLLGRGRGVELTLDAFSRVGPDKHVVFLGYGPLERLVKEAAARHSNIHFSPAVPPDRVLEITRNADVGLAMIEDVCLSYRYCLPNKLFEYILSGIPVIASDFPDMGQVIDDQHCGWRTRVDSAALHALVSRLDRAMIAAQTSAMRQQPIRFGWHHEAEVLLSAYRRCLGAPASASI
ncbi:MAG: glycosyltransferase [Deltaproteobacteria bacterium]|nr:glycosyltransferase [Deltaproteobacteria bacterium]